MPRKSSQEEPLNIDSPSSVAAIMELLYKTILFTVFEGNPSV